jgi:hypothetical protein
MTIIALLSSLKKGLPAIFINNPIICAKSLKIFTLWRGIMG